MRRDVEEGQLLYKLLEKMLTHYCERISFGSSRRATTTDNNEYLDNIDQH